MLLTLERYVKIVVTVLLFLVCITVYSNYKTKEKENNADNKKQEILDTIEDAINGEYNKQDLINILEDLKVKIKE